MSSIPKLQRKRHLGQVFTPPKIAKHLVTLCEIDLSQISVQKRVIDLACGDGQLLMALANMIMQMRPKADWPRHFAGIVGWDIDSGAIRAARANLEQLTGWKGWRLECKDALRSKDDGFSWCIANPPYLRIQELSPQTRKEYREKFISCTGSFDLYMPFVEKISAISKTAAIICPTGILSSSAGKALRKLLVEKKQIAAASVHKKHLFPDASVDTCFLSLRNEKRSSLALHTSSRIIDIPYSNLSKGEDWVVASKSPKSRKSLRDICDIHTGVQTSLDKVFILQPGDVHILRTHRADKSRQISVFASGKKRNIEAGALRVIVKGSLSEKNPHHKSFLIFPYEKGVNGEQVLIPERDFARRYPLAYRYVKENRKKLSARDNAREDPKRWYAFGRGQGLNLTTKKLAFSPYVSPKRMLHVSVVDEHTYFSGYAAIPRSGTTMRELKAIFSSSRFLRYCRRRGKLIKGGWLQISPKIVLDFPLR